MHPQSPGISTIREKKCMIVFQGSSLGTSSIYGVVCAGATAPRAGGDRPGVPGWARLCARARHLRSHVLRVQEQEDLSLESYISFSN